MLAKISNIPGSSRFLHTSRTNLVLQQKPLPSSASARRIPATTKKKAEVIQTEPEPVTKSKKAEDTRHGESLCVCNMIGIHNLLS